MWNSTVTAVCELCCVMLVRQIQSHYGDTSLDSELGLTVRTAAARETEKLQFIFLLTRSLKETGETLHVKPRNERQEVLPRYPEVSSNSSIISLQEHRGYKKIKQLLEKSFSKRKGVLEIQPEWQPKMWCYHNYFKSFELKSATSPMFLVPSLCWC